MLHDTTRRPTLLTAPDEGSGGGPDFGKQPAPGDQPPPSFEKPAEPAPQGFPTPQQPPQGYPAPQQPQGYPAPPAYPAPQQPAGYPAAPPIGPGGTPGYQQPWPQGPTYELSGWWRRVGATLLDGLIILVLMLPLIGIGIGVGALSFNDSASDGTAAFGVLTIIVLFFIYIAVALIYAPYAMSKLEGATLGKKALGIRVVRVDGQPMDFSNSAIREIVVKQILFNWILGTFTLGLAYIIDCLWPLWDSEHRALHDMLVKTRVVRA